MVNDITLFKFQDQPVRTVLINDEPYFIGKDVAKVLGYSNTRDALNKHVDAEDKGVAKCDTPGGVQKLQAINESGVYSLVFASKLPKAKEFKHWVTSEVLPTIRKHGAYMTNQKAHDILTNKNDLADLLQQAADQLKSKDIQIQQMKPKALFADAVSTSRSAILIGELAKVLKGNGINIGQNRLFSWLREHGYLIKRNGTDYNMPTQKSMNLGLFKIKETTINHSDGHITVSKTPKVTGKGQQYFIDLFLRKQANNNG
jgi:anti-repressor protein